MTAPCVLLLGGGKMGAAMLAGWRRTGLGPSWVIDPAPEAAGLAGGVVQVAASADAVAGSFRPDAVMLAVKPQIASDAVPAIRSFAVGAVVVSIMAGRTVAGLVGLSGVQAVVRAMPNTPAAIGAGFTAAFAAPAVSPAQRSLTDTLLRAAGEVAWVPDEAMLDAVTATSGSGPAYVFLLAELLEQEAMAQGLPAGLARRLARQTVAGAGALLVAGDGDAAEMRRAVTSPNGTTQAALDELMAPDAWPAAMHRAIAAATRRSRELSS